MLGRHKDVTHPDENLLQQDWKNEINFNDDYFERKEVFLDMM